MSAADDATPSGRPAAARVGLAPPAPADVQAPFRRQRGRALMLGHVHPDADVLGTLLALGLALESRGWSVVYGGPHPAPSALGFLPGVERYQILKSVDGPFDVAVLTDCPNPARTEGLVDEARAATPVVVNIDHHPDNRRYGHVNWIDTSAIESVRVACLLRERGTQVKVSLRGKGDVDVQRIAARFGGGGHPNAAGFTVAGSLDAVTREVLTAVRESLRR